MSHNRELEIVEYEAARNDAMDQWFDARQHIDRTRENEAIFEGGFRIAWFSSALITKEQA